jgi:23S rRNA (pseudouridine1915-N3)-methyltransferase
LKLHLWSVGKSHESYVEEGIHLFTKRLQSYFPAAWNIIPLPKNSGQLSPEMLKSKESESILQGIKKEDYLILLDEKGKSMSSMKLAEFLQKRANEGSRNLIFLIGGAFGVSEEIKQRADFTWSLSDLVFPHQLTRLILAEQLYRACTILRNEKYHHI